MKSKLFIYILIFCVGTIHLNHPVSAQEHSNHYTLFINQVRGAECCDPGKLDFFLKQLETFDENDLTAHFALRYDALMDETYVAKTRLFPNQEYGLLIEITPSLAIDATVPYAGSTDTWYQANHSMLVGYSQEERKKIIDTLFSKYYEIFGTYPSFTTSWMIDPWSLQYMKNTYGVISHQITREQFGTDTYTLYGGPPHYPYIPSNNWALVPDSDNTRMPIIVRQTITDPVFNYGDRTNSFTSQPNDYAIRGAAFEYFTFIFDQAHSQPNSYTFGLLGLENSMEERFQEEYFRQVRYVSDWAKKDTNKVITVKNLPEILKHANQSVYVYQGRDQESDSSQAWWIRTDTYRARIRLSDNELYISDLRIYDERFSDPYSNAKAEAAGWWIIPFIIDGSRYYSKTSSGLETYNDFLLNRRQEQGSPERITLYRGNLKGLQLEREGEKVHFTLNDQILATFLEDSITAEINAPAFESIHYPHSSEFKTWSPQINDNTMSFTVYETDLDRARKNFKSELFPEASFGKADQNKSELYVNNRYAVAGRNPARLVLFPRDAQGQAVKLSNLPVVTSSNKNVSLEVYDSDSKNGMIFIDIESNSVRKTDISVVSGDSFSKSETVYFAPNCRSSIFSCLNPYNAYLYVKSYLGDRERARQEALRMELEKAN